jgi:hypothetical protein
MGHNILHTIIQSLANIKTIKIKTNPRRNKERIRRNNNPPMKKTLSRKNSMINRLRNV